jgi:hypothetical protein
VRNGRSQVRRFTWNSEYDSTLLKSVRKTVPRKAHDEPDVYETNDLPESEQVTDFFEEENDSIERIHISASEAFNKFKGKFLKANTVDFRNASANVFARATMPILAIGSWSVRAKERHLCRNIKDFSAK